MIAYRLSSLVTLGVLGCVPAYAATGPMSPGDYSDVGEYVGVIALILIAIFGYFLPWIVANARQHYNSGAIFVVNLFFGWSLIGWVVALVWAVTKPAPSQQLNPA